MHASDPEISSTRDGVVTVSNAADVRVTLADGTDFSLVDLHVARLRSRCRLMDGTTLLHAAPSCLAILRCFPGAPTQR